MRRGPVYGLTTGNEVQQADAIQAYIQADIRGEVWVCLPLEARPDSWAHMRCPAVKLHKALYGHPDSGSFWEDHCTQKVLERGFETLP